ncbi:hypothetical protein LIER_29746 [Lithospermum erythrorhizon]|uniref:DDE Tnp4 domain-containing protein n=1 Tax=Lithospermum erythrorhizon TaxID=34254 RepID=A0AAV3RNV3_LITER
MTDKSDSRTLVVLLSTLISQLITSLILLFPPCSQNTPLTTLPLLHHLDSISHIASTISLIPFSRKRKRDHEQLMMPRNPDVFKSFFNMNSSTFEWLCSLLEPLLECRDPAHSPLNLKPESRLGIGLFRLATGADHGEISTRFFVSQSTAKFCVKQLCRVLCTNYRFWVGFPSRPELDSVSTQFQTLTGLPNCCGIVHCTRFQVKTNNFSDSFAAQIVVDSSSRILSIAAGFRGNKDDFQVLKASTLYNDIENGILLNSSPVSINEVSVPQYLVGDGSYPMLRWLVVPVSDPIGGSNEENFNNVVDILRSRAHRTVTSLRNWHVLSRPIEADFKSAVAYVGACSILHNMLLMKEDYTTCTKDVDDHTLSSHRFQFSSDRGSEEGGVVNKELASDIRSALATKARTSHSMDHETHEVN